MTLEAFTGGEVPGKDWGQGGASVAGQASGKAGMGRSPTRHHHRGNKPVTEVPYD